jgi:transposase-like protein
MKSRRKFSKEFKLDAVQRLRAGEPAGLVARSLEVSRQELYWPKLFSLTLEGVSRVSLVFAPLRALSPRLVGKGDCANEDDSKAMHTTSRVRQSLRASAVLNNE